MAIATLKVAMKKSTLKSLARVDSNWDVNIFTYFSTGYENFWTKIEGV